MMLAKRTILVTGAGSGIGRGIALAVAEEGAAVAALDLDPDSAEATAAAITEPDGRAIALTADVTNAVAVEEAIATAAERFGRLDALVNNAGVLRMSPALEAGDDDWTIQLEVNSRALFSCCRLAAKSFREHPVEREVQGTIINVASNAGKVGYPNMAGYNASKAAVISLTRSLAAEWAPHGINVNAVCPGGVDTPMLDQVARWVSKRAGLDPNELKRSMVPEQLGRHIQPLEVGKVVAFLLSDRAAIIRGQSINVDGGDTPY